MPQEELATRMAAEEETLRKSAWGYDLNRGVMELLAPLLEGAVGPDFTAYAQALEAHAQERSWAGLERETPQWL